MQAYGCSRFLVCLVGIPVCTQCLAAVTTARLQDLFSSPTETLAPNSPSPSPSPRQPPSTSCLHELDFSRNLVEAESHSISFLLKAK